MHLKYPGKCMAYNTINVHNNNTYALLLLITGKNINGKNINNVQFYLGLFDILEVYLLKSAPNDECSRNYVI